MLLTVAAPSVAAQDGPPAITVDRTGTAAGETVLVQGTGWDGTGLVYVELCGNAGRGGSRSCDQSGATLAGVSTTGTFGATITAAKPPVPCPCVVKATSQTNQSVATASLAVQDVAVVDLDAQTEMTTVERAVEISSITLHGSGPWTTWFGAGASRTLSFTIENVGDVAVHDPPLTVAVGKGSPPGGVVRAPDVGSIEAGESVDVEIPVTFDALSFGRHSAMVKVDGFATPAVATAHTSTYPWGLIAIGLVLLQLVLLYIRNRARRRFERHLIDDDDPDVDDPDVDDTDDAVIDEGADGAEIDLRDPAPTEEAEEAEEAPTTVVDLREHEPTAATSETTDESPEPAAATDETSEPAGEELPNPFDDAPRHTVVDAMVDGAARPASNGYHPVEQEVEPAVIAQQPRDLEAAFATTPRSWPPTW